MLRSLKLHDMAHAVEPIIGHLKAVHRFDRSYLEGRDGERVNAILAAVGYNFKRIAAWLIALLPQILWMLKPQPKTEMTRNRIIQQGLFRLYILAKNPNGIGKSHLLKTGDVNLS